MTSHDNVTDIVERLWKLAPHSAKPTDAILIEEAADIIATLRKQLENAREALERISSGRSSVTECSLIARIALKGQP